MATGWVCAPGELPPPGDETGAGDDLATRPETETVERDCGRESGREDKRGAHLVASGRVVMAREGSKRGSGVESQHADRTDR